MNNSNKAAAGLTPRVDALMSKWDDDGATRGSAFIELRDLARDLESALLASAAPADEPVAEFGRNSIFIIQNQPNGERWPEGTKLYTRAAPAAQPDRNAIIEECAQRVESRVSNLTPVEIMGEDRHEQSKNVIANVAAAVRALKSAATTTSQPDEARDAALMDQAANLAIKFTAVPRDVLGPATPNMKTLAAVGEKIAAAIRALAPTAASPSHPDPELQKVGVEYEADDGTVAARRNGELLWHAHIYANDDSLNEAEVAKQVVSRLAGSPHPVQQQEQGDEHLHYNYFDSTEDEQATRRHRAQKGK